MIYTVLNTTDDYCVLLQLKLASSETFFPPVHPYKVCMTLLLVSGHDDPSGQHVCHQAPAQVLVIIVHLVTSHIGALVTHIVTLRTTLVT